MKSTLFSTQNGMSAIKAIILIVVLAGLGAGGYFGYTNYLAPMLNPYAKLLPEGLKEYVKGANADAFVVYKKDQELEDNLKKLPPEMMVANSVQSAVLVVQVKNKGMVAYIEFGSENEATMAKSYMEGNVQDNPDYKFDLRGNVLVMGEGLGEEAFYGSLLENPNIGRINKDRLEDQLIAYVDIANLSELSGMLPAMTGTLPISVSDAETSDMALVRTAHAQSGFVTTSDNGSEAGLSEPMATDGMESGLPDSAISSAMMSNFLKDATLYLRLKDGILSSEITFNILPKAELANSSLVTSTMKDVGPAELEKTYDQSLAEFTKSVPDLNRLAGLVKMVAPSVELKMVLNDLAFVITIDTPLQNLVDLAVKEDVVGSVTEGPSKAHDAAKKAELDNVIVAAEQYNAANGNYPEKSMCVDQMSELSEYFKNQTAPTDDKGSQNFEGLECSGGYYYQWIPDLGYVVWAKMELVKDGNMAISPDQYKANLEQKIITEKVSEGQYYAYGDGLWLDKLPPGSIINDLQGSPNVTQATADAGQQPKVKVQR